MYEQDYEVAQKLITKDKLVGAFRAANEAHHEYENTALNGQRDELWSGMYALYTLGKLGDFAKPSDLAKWLQEPTQGDDWATGAADNVLKRLPPNPMAK
jgi:hypothetical protein